MKTESRLSAARTRSFCVLAVATILTVASTRTLAHHAIAGQFDMTNTLHLKGMVSKLEWTNPHVYIYFDVKDSSNAVTTWKLETLPVAMLRKAGITQKMLAYGEAVTMDISPARDGTVHLGFILNIQFPDGRKFQFSRDPNGTVSGSK